MKKFRLWAEFFLLRARCTAIYSASRDVINTNTRPRNRSGVCLIYPLRIRGNSGNCVLPSLFSDPVRWRLLRIFSLTLSITDMSDLPGECDAHRPVSQQCWKKTRVPLIHLGLGVLLPLYLYRQLFFEKVARLRKIFRIFSELFWNLQTILHPIILIRNIIPLSNLNVNN